MPTPSDLSDIRNHLYQRAELWWVCTLAISAITLFLGLVALWVNSTAWITFGGVFAIAAPIAIAWMREAASLNMLRGDKCRRLILYADGLGHDISPEDLAQARAWTLRTTPKDAPFVRPYYSSTVAPGPQRLADILVESTFFTEHLTGKLASWLWIAFGLAVTFACMILYVADLQSATSYLFTFLVAKSAAVLVSFLLAGDFLLIAKKYSDLRNEAHQSYARCARLRSENNVSADEVRAAAEDYNVAILQAPPIPVWLYRIYRDELNRIYRHSHAVTTG